MEKRRMDNPKTVIYYNPKCSKCRMTLKLLHDQGEQPQVIEYLQAVPTRSDIESILAQLGVTAGQLLRRHEPAYREAGLDESSSDEEDTGRDGPIPYLDRASDRSPRRQGRDRTTS